ncbi:hypothetical protein HYH02_005111 [Chlamydomonas schloesseri]|uniref:Uncharacterized protein n=1 Tax=Chlamydomonas schloesseri TaxID=2026947 RepID=A0A835WKW9_9CHLO|nr:hypothetical protein HYH02_005111 [Chlamydomonas schloesseri]|eukprot:KAG2449578.1 hypothetical protein HYH02_005111 [Chlamydomonas schloesseri]
MLASQWLAHTLIIALAAEAAAQGTEWRTLPNMSIPLGEVASGLLQDAAGNPQLLVIGRFSGVSHPFNPQTMILNLSSSTWYRGADRLHVGDHHTADVVGNKLYVAGGFSDNASGKLQIYDPIKDAWTLGAAPPVNSGAAASAVLGRSIYYCGGVLNGDQARGPPTTACARYDVDAGTWVNISSMPYAVHHASGGSDDQRYFYVFGGRSSNGNTPFGPVGYTQRYDTITDEWDADLPELPVGRGGMGPAIYLDGRFHIFSGEVRCGSAGIVCPDADTGLTSTGVYTRIDRYDPPSGTWDLAPSPGILVPRHGIYPVLGQAPPAEVALSSRQVVYVCSGGTREGYSPTALCDYMLGGAPPAPVVSSFPLPFASPSSSSPPLDFRSGSGSSAMPPTTKPSTPPAEGFPAVSSPGAAQPVLGDKGFDGQSRSGDPRAALDPYPSPAVSKRAPPSPDAPNSSQGGYAARATTMSCRWLLAAGMMMVFVSSLF